MPLLHFLWDTLGSILTLSEVDLNLVRGLEWVVVVRRVEKSFHHFLISTPGAGKFAAVVPELWVASPKVAPLKVKNTDLSLVKDLVMVVM